ncbi:MAG: chemotaxis protein CheB [Ignavibacteria bacterium]|nr:chemotaxis protein CheB [Ignavibacteria bacterium]
MTPRKKDKAKASVATRDAKTIEAQEIAGKAAELQETGEEPAAGFPIVGIGASAGGLEALELFLANVPEDSGMAFVIVQHLDPTHKGIIVELLQRGTSMKVFQVKDRMRVEANCVYVIPPNKDMSILRGVLHLLDLVLQRGLRLPIDFFFRALADDQQEHSIGVILSGMGSDGTLGLRAIKEKAGVVFVQEPASAKFDGMPRSAIDAGLADVIAPVEALPGKISAYLQHVPLITKPGRPDEYTAQSALEKVVILLRGQMGHDFSLYKKATVYRRIERRMGLHHIDKNDNYVRFLQVNPQEVELLFRELLIEVTSFFRDPKAWEQLKAEVLPALLTGRTSYQALRAWIPACATGEEAYSLAILFKETLEELKPAKNITVQIFATDLDQRAIEKAREGVFPANIAADVSAKRLDRFFVKVECGYQVAKSIRETVIFAPQNIIMDPPFTKLDLVSCRNLLIYLTPELQKKLLLLFHYSLNPGGFLFLGDAETVGNFTNLFAPLAGKTRLYRRLASALTTEPIEFPTTFIAAQPGAPARPLTPTADLQTLADQLLLQTYSPAAVLTNDKGDILYISGRTGKYLEPAAGKANWNIFAMAREGLRYELTAAFRKALRQKENVTLKNMVVGTNGGKRIVNVTIQPLSGPNALHGMVMIVFTDVAAMPKTKTTSKPRGDSTRTAELEQKLKHARQEVQSMREEMQTSQEELKSSNEELQSTNEELQSTNEELTTLKEELQSMNEELRTVNQELQTRLDELSRTNNDMKNLLDSTDIATLFLDNSLCVRRFTSETSKITKLITGDVGRPITDIASALFYPELADDAHQVLRTLIRVEKQIPIPDGDWFAARILPYRTLDNMIDGVVITFIDITVSKKLEAELRATEARSREILEFAESIINTVREPLIALDQDLRVVTASRSFYEVFKVKPEETVGQLIYDLGNKQWDIPKLRELLETILPQKTTFDNYEVEHDFTTIGRRIMLLNARQIQRVLGKERIILLAIEDITERKRAEEALR